MEDSYWIERALYWACRSFSLGEVPIGAVIVYEGKCIAESGNLVEHHHQSCSHAEMICLRQAADQLKGWRLNQAILYSTLEPCTMCWGAMHLYRIKRCVYACEDPKHGFIHGLNQGEKIAYPNHKLPVELSSDLLLKERSKNLLSAFFQLRRRQKKI